MSLYLPHQALPGKPAVLIIARPVLHVQGLARVCGCAAPKTLGEECTLSAGGGGCFLPTLPGTPK